ncbi:MAG: hypothetical protein EPN25_05440 [Nitrospirae bacterium]|nr:MAG: hypothetical protein EPN25_05440 [Nitrospirota bacterium]
MVLNMSDAISIEYIFTFEDGRIEIFTLLLDRQTLSLIGEDLQEKPGWTELLRNRCSLCSLDEQSHTHCPIALNMAGIASAFRDCYAYEKVKVTVETEERTYTKETIIQEGLGSLIGIIMVASGCPTMEYLKPMVRFHLPFASLHETIFRMASVYLLAQYFIKQEGREPAWDLARIQDIYGRVGELNRDFAQRLAQAATKDANANALVNLDCFASMVPLAVDDILTELKQYFSAYLRHGSA